MCPCDGAAYILRRSGVPGPRATKSTHHTALLRHLDVVTKISQQSTTKLQCKSCKHVMAGARERIAAHYLLRSSLGEKCGDRYNTYAAAHWWCDCSFPALVVVLPIVSATEIYSYIRDRYQYYSGSAMRGCIIKWTAAGHERRA